MHVAPRSRMGMHGVRFAQTGRFARRPLVQIGAGRRAGSPTRKRPMYRSGCFHA